MLLWLVGLLFEAVGDWQLERYKADKAAGKDVGQVMDRGLWRLHPASELLRRRLRLGRNLLCVVPSAGRAC